MRRGNVIDLSISDDDEIIAVPRKPRTSIKRKREPTVDLRSDSEPEYINQKQLAQTVRPALQELTPEQFSNRIRGPKAWVKRPKYDHEFIQQYCTLDVRPKEINAPSSRPGRGISSLGAPKTSQVPSPKAWVERPKYSLDFIQQYQTANSTSHEKARTHKNTSNFFAPPKTSLAAKAGSRHFGTAANASGHHDELASGVRRPRRAAAKSAFDVLMKRALVHDESSEDEIAVAKVSPKAVAGSSTKRRSTASKLDGSDYEEHDSTISPSEDSVSTSDDSVAGSDASEQEDPPVKAKPTKKPAPTAATGGKRNATGKSQNTGKQTRLVKLVSRKKHASGRGLDLSLPPISDIRDIFQDLTTRALSFGFDKTLKALSDRPIRVATMCSGTESPLLALEMIGDSLKLLGQEELQIEHLFSAEIVPFKQAYIERNFSPPLIFRDITEITGAVDQDHPVATTAYGAKAAIPTDIDIVIAGTSCVDFSMRNKHRKGLDDGGESADTFAAVLAYCRAYKPSIVLLENVSTAPYDTMMAKYEAAGYETASVHVDTKNYYIPHTRQRGYMVCFSREKISAKISSTAAQEWVALMDRFKRFATAPISSFLLPRDQIDLRHIRVDEAAREVDWSQCEITQMDYRQRKKLGSSRPFTHWTESGSTIPPDNGHAPFFRARVERELDTMDVSVLRKARPENGMYDSRFKTRIWDLSQNVYMSEDTNAFGITGCLTPTMRAFVSDACRALDAKEALQLQGIPLHKISFTTESHAEIQDLAGNAMSSTVIGTSIVSALIAGCKILQSAGGFQENREVVGLTRDQSPALDLVAGTPDVVVRQDHLAIPDMEDLTAKAERALRRCYCEGHTSTAEKPIQRCVECGHTTCIACGGNPQHHYQSAHLLGQARSSPIEFEAHIRSILPLALNLSKSTLPDLPKDYGLIVAELLASPLRFQSIRRTHCWTVTYRALHGHLELVLGDRVSEWRLYAHPSKELAANDQVRVLLQQPVLTSNATSSFEGNDWQLRVPKPAKCSVRFCGSGRQVTSWFARLGLPEYRRHTMWERLEIKVDSEAVACLLDGVYRYLPRCGTASEGLYKKDGVNDHSAIYLFLDPDRIGEPNEDSYVFSHNKNIMEYDEVRPLIARVAPGWRPWSLNPDQGTPSKSEAILHVDHAWQRISTTLNAMETHLEIRKPRNLRHLIDSTDCSGAANVLSCVIHPGSTDSIDLLREDQVAKAYAWIYEAMRRHLHLNGSCWQRLRSNYADTHCETCAPPLPALRWQLSGGDIREYEDPAAASRYEHAIKARPIPIEVCITSLEDGIKFDLGVNIRCLAHRASSRLSSHKEIAYEWRLVTNSREEEFIFKPFKLLATRAQYPKDQDQVLSVKLFPKQQQVVAWMKTQEEGVLFELEETEVGTLPHLGWRAEVRAQAAVEVRGGVCADHPGFGKTVTSLAVIQSQLSESTASEIVAELASRQVVGLIPTTATLIVCPLSLQNQWISEIEDKTGSLNGVLSVTSAASLNKFTLADFRNARIIVVNRSVLTSDAYIDRLATFAAMPGPATSSRRGLVQWLAFATKEVPDHVQKLLRSERAAREHIRQKYRENIESEAFKAAVPSRRLRGRDYVASKSKVKATERPAAKEIDTAQISRPLFEMFYFNRVIFDEFHQYDAKDHAAACNIKADKRWLLSGTPAIGDFYEVAQLAKLLGVSLRIGRDDRATMKVKSIRELRQTMTDFERFDSARQHASNATQGIYDHHRTFLNAFVRQNIMDFAQFKTQEHLVPVTLDSDHAALYTEVLQQFNSLDMRIKKGAKVEATDREGRFIDASKSSSTAEEALSKLAAFHDRGSNADLHSLIARRHQEVKKIKCKLPSSFLMSRTEEKDKYLSLRTQIESGAFGDQQITNELLTIMQSPEATSKASARSVLGNTSDEENFRAQSAKTKTAGLNRQCKRLVTAHRSARYLLNVMSLERLRLAKSRVKCDDPKCQGKDDASRVAVSALCGHKVCRSCHHRHKDHALTQCPADGCSSSYQDFHLLWIAKLNPNSDTGSPYGAKLQAAMRLLQCIEQKQEQAVLFVQFDEQIREVKAALRDASIRNVVVNTAGEAGHLLSEFRESAETDHQITAVVLNASDETAAGSNLQNANHVIFLSPLLRDTQYGYDATNAQAIGRVRRYGQKRDIHVYRIAALNTIDIDILEHRHRLTDALTQVGGSEIIPPASAVELNVHGEATAERTQLVFENEVYSLRPRSWLVRCGADEDSEEWEKVKGKSRIMGWEDFSSLVKFSRSYTEDDD